jgi:hypothetical protein
MSKDTYDKGVFSFIDGVPKQLWTTVMLILDQNIKVETELAISQEIQGEKRIHQCGRVNALKEFRDILVSERKSALDSANVNWAEDETLK